MTTHELAKLLLNSPEIELRGDVVLYAKPDDYAGLGFKHYMLAYADDKGFPRSITWSA